MNRNIPRIAGLLLVAAFLAGCGGGGGGGAAVYPFPPVSGNNPPENPPPQADAYDSFIAYVQSLVASVLDTAEPANVAAFDPAPTSETKDPVATQ